MTTMKRFKTKCSSKSHFLFLPGCVLEMVVEISAHTQQAEEYWQKYHMVMFYTQATILSALFQSKHPHATIV